MLKELRLRMAASNIAMTGLVFLALMLMMASLSENTLRRTRDLGFQNDVNSFATVLRASNTVSTTWLASAETGGRYLIFVESGGAPFAFKGAWKPHTDRETLYAAADEAFGAAFGYQMRMDGSRWWQGAIRGTGGEEYRCARVTFDAFGADAALTVVGDLLAERRMLARQRWQYAGLSVVGLAALCLIGWWFSGRAVRPAAQSLQKQKEFIAAASHELKTPLAVIGASISALRLKPEKAERMLANIEAECGQMGRLVEDLLLLANLDAKSWSICLEPVEVDTVLIGTVEQYRELAKDKGYSLGLELSDALIPPVLGDGQRLAQVVGILVGNALEYAGTGGEIVVRAAAVPHGVCITVEDHGVGIPPEERQRVFERFYRVDKARSGKKHFGLGLAIAAELVRLQGGTIELTETPGGGCTFQITLRPAA